MIPNNNLNPLPWYTDVAEQNHRKEWAYNRVYPLICQSRILLPFQVIRNHLETSPLTSFKLVELETGTETEILTEITESNIVIKETAEFDIIMNYGRFLLPSEFSFKGMYYCIMTDGTNLWFSEVFNFIQDVSEYVKIVWYNRNDIFEHESGYIDYNDGYQNFIYLASDIGKPEYPFEEEVFERDGHTFPEKQWSEKVYKFDFIAPEYMLDAMRIIRMHDYIWVQQKGKLWDVEQFLWEHEWEEQGDLASVEAEFHCDTVMKKIGKGIEALIAGDYNDDFNNDFSGGEGEGGEPTTHEFWIFTGETTIGVGYLVRGCRILVKVKSTGEVIWDETSSSYKFRKEDFGAGITYEVTITRDGYFDKTFDFIAGSANPQNIYVLIDENPATINQTVNTGGYDVGASALIPNVDIDMRAEQTSVWINLTNSGASGTVAIQYKKGIEWEFRYRKTGYTTRTLYVSDSFLDDGENMYAAM